MLEEVAVVEGLPHARQLIGGHRHGAEDQRGHQDGERATLGALGQEELDELPARTISAGDDDGLEEESGQQVAAEDRCLIHGRDNRCRPASVPRKRPTDLTPAAFTDDRRCAPDPDACMHRSPSRRLAACTLLLCATLAIGVTDAPDSIEAYFTGLEESGISINFGSYFSETQARVPVLGNSSRAPTAPELERMRDIMTRAMRQGAMGMTTALIYPPSSFATTDELVEVGRAAAALGGIYASHIRDEGPELVAAVREAIEVGERAGMPVEIFHYKGAYEPGWGRIIREAADEIEAARARGVDVAADVYPYTAGGTGLEATIPSWVFDGGADSVRARIARPEVRAQLKEQLETGHPGWFNIVEASGGWDRIVLVNARNEDNARFEGMHLADIGEAWGKDPADAAWDLVSQGSGRVMAIYHMMSEDDVSWALQRPWVSIGSDAGAALSAGVTDGLGLPHPRSYGTFPRVLARYVRDTGALTLEEAVRKMTSWPATRMRLERRGVIREGAWADITIFDLGRMDDRATYDEPVLFPTGIEYVLVNGVVVIEDGGTHTGARPGHVLYGPGRDPGR